MPAAGLQPGDLCIVEKPGPYQTKVCLVLQNLPSRTLGIDDMYLIATHRGTTRVRHIDVKVCGPVDRLALIAEPSIIKIPAQVEIDADTQRWICHCRHFGSQAHGSGATEDEAVEACKNVLVKMLDLPQGIDLRL